MEKQYAMFEICRDLRRIDLLCQFELSKERHQFIFPRLLLDSRVVDLPMAHNPTFVTLSSLKPLFFNSLKNELRFSDNVGA